MLSALRRCFFYADVLKFFGCELGAQTKFDKKVGTSIVNGAHDASKLAELLEIFIKKYVQCYSCGNPETVVKIRKENIFLKCKACGFVSEVDPRLRLNTFIVKNPPENKMSKAEKKVKKAEKERLKGLDDTAAAEEKKKKKSSKKKKEGEEGDANDGEPADDEVQDEDGDQGDDDEEDEDGEDVVWMTDTSEEAMKRRAAEQLSAATAAMVTQGNVEAEREEDRKREEKRRKEEEEAAKAAEAARLAAEAEAKMKLKSDLVAAVQRGATPAEVATEVKAIEGGPAIRMKALYEALFGELVEGDRLSSAVSAKAKYLAPHAGDAAGQLAQLVAVEYMLGVGLEGRVREAPLVLKTLYDEDLAEEDLILAWYAKDDAGAVLDIPSDKAAAVREAAKPFVTWLEEASDDEGDSEEEE